MRLSQSQFIESLNDIPVEDLFRAIEEECRRIEHCSHPKQIHIDEITTSILVFRRFINAVMLGVRLAHYVLPTEVAAAYRETVARLVKAGRLPSGASEEFDKMFSSASGDSEIIRRPDGSLASAEKKGIRAGSFCRAKS